MVVPETNQSGTGASTTQWAQHWSGQLASHKIKHSEDTKLLHASMLHIECQPHPRHHQWRVLKQHKQVCILFIHIFCHNTVPVLVPLE